eukprot:GHVP01004010.1.p1 GENE.GHVP01004010.1~~GHVP01004010.1.p1  ORF type:complete len:106 (+),score=15.16 GHVP01004010.1:1088-1405(+)
MINLNKEINIKELNARNDKFYVKNDEFYVKNDEFVMNLMSNKKKKNFLRASFDSHVLLKLPPVFLEQKSQIPVAFSNTTTNFRVLVLCWKEFDFTLINKLSYYRH